MRWVLLVLGVLLLLFLLLCLLRLGVLITLDETVAVRVKAGPVHIQVIPAKEKKKPGKKPPPSEAEKPKKAKKEKKEKAGFPKPTPSDIRSAVETLWRPLLRALDRTRRGIRLHPLTLAVFFGGAEDPASAARTMGCAHMAVWNGMPLLEKVLDIPEPSIHLETDFTAEATKVRGQVGLTIRIGTLLAVGFQVAVPAVKWLLSYLKRHKNDQSRKKNESTGATKENASAA